MKKYNWLKTMVACLVIALLFRHPMTRAAILFILPLGSGIDDLIVIIALVAALIIFAVKWDAKHGIYEGFTRWFKK